MGKQNDLDQAQKDWERRTAKEVLTSGGERKKEFLTESGIPTKRLYTPNDLADIGFDYLKDLGFPGQYPFTRGKESLGYRANYWLFQQYAGFGDPDEANKRYKYLLDQGQSGVSIAFDLPTQVGMDSDHPMAEGEVGKVGVAMNTLEDLERIFRGIPLDKPRQISLVANSMGIIVLAMVIALAKKQGVPTDRIVVRIQNDILKEFIARGTYIYPPKPSLKLANDLVIYCAENCPNWLPMTLCGYHIREAGATSSQEIAFTLANALENLDGIARKGFDLRKVLPKLSVMLSVSTNFFEDIAKVRALRRLWARVIRERYKIDDTSVLPFSLVSFTSGSSLTAQQPLNNLIRVTIECLAGVLAGCQSLFPSSYDEALCTPSENAVKLALRTQQIIAYETDVVDTVDPLGGSYFIETLTTLLEREAEKYLESIEKIGGAVEAIESGYFQNILAEEAYKTQKAIEDKQRIRVGVNNFVEHEEIPIEVFKPPKDSSEKQKRRLAELRKTRDKGAVNRVLNQLRERAAADENLVPFLVEAVENYATIGEICDVFRDVFGEHNETQF